VKNTFAQRNPKNGLIEIVCMDTGNILAIQKSEENLLEAKKSQLVETQIEGKTVWLEKGISADRITERMARPYSKVIGDIMCQEIREGNSITGLCKKAGYPNYSVFSRWRAMDDEFHTQVALAIKDRAETRAEKALEIAAEAETRDGNPDYQLHVNTLKWAAEKDNPERFGKQIKHTGDENAPLVWHINTGIVREEDLAKEPTLVVDADAKELPDSSEEIVGEAKEWEKKE